MTMADSYGPGGQDPRSGGQQNNTYNYNYSYGSGSGRGAAPGGRPPQKSDWSEWVGIGVLFLLPFWFTKLISVIWFFRKLGSMDKSQKKRYRQEASQAAQRARNTAESFFRQTADAAQRGADTARQAADSARQRAQAQDPAPGAYRYGQSQGAPQQPRQSQSRTEPWEQNAQPDAWNLSESGRKKARRKAGSGTGLIIAGSIVSGIFALGSTAISIDVLRSIIGGYFWPEDIVGLLACMMFMAGGLAMLFSGIGKNRSSERYLNYLAYIGANREVALAPMAASFGVSVSKLCKDLRRMLAKGVLPTGYLDLAEGKLYLTEMGYRAPEPTREAPPVQEETPQEAAAREDDILREIRQVNYQIPDAVMSAKIDRIEEITGKILAYQKAHPNKEGQLRTFLNYYLPTTLKILRAYAQLDAQGIEGENISAAKKRIEDMMDQVVSGFEKQLDKLFQDDAMDITSDVEVLENMLKKDGLSDEGGITMTL